MHHYWTYHGWGYRVNIEYKKQRHLQDFIWGYAPISDQVVYPYCEYQVVYPYKSNQSNTKHFNSDLREAFSLVCVAFVYCSYCLIQFCKWMAVLKNARLSVWMTHFQVLNLPLKKTTKKGVNKIFFLSSLSVLKYTVLLVLKKPLQIIQWEIGLNVLKFNLDCFTNLFVQITGNNSKEWWMKESLFFPTHYVTLKLNVVLQIQQSIYVSWSIFAKMFSLGYETKHFKCIMSAIAVYSMISWLMTCGILCH